MAAATAKRVDIRVVRIIKCLRLLQSASYSVSDLAALFGVSRRTVYRDLRLLVAAEVPLARRVAGRRLYVPPPA
jgi:predicted DNA-binding transcriptional regulator YafY